MAGTQGSSFSSSKSAAASNAKTTSNLKSGLNASGSSKTSSGLGNKPASSSVNAAAANAARTAAARAATASTQATQRTGSSQSGYGASRPASANVNAAAARAAMANNQRSAGITQSSMAGKGDAFGANQTVSKGTNLSAGDMLSGGYGQYKNPSAGVAMAARPNTTVANKGINLSSGDLLAGGYGQYRQAPSAQSTPQAAGNGFADLAGLQSLTAGMNPSFSQMIAGDNRTGFGRAIGLPGGEIEAASRPAALDRVLTNAGYGQTPSQVAQFNYGQQPVMKDISRLASAPDLPVSESYWANKQQLPADKYAAIQQRQQPPTVASVPSLPNYSDPVSIAAREPQGYTSMQQTAGYQNPARSFPSRPTAQPTQAASLTSPMAGQGTSFRSPTGRGSAQAYNEAMIGSISDARYNGAMAQPTSSQEPVDASMYGDAPQELGLLGKAAEETRSYVKGKTDWIKEKGNQINGLLGGSPDGGNVQTNPNARDDLNNLPPKEQERVVSEAGKAAWNPEFNALPDADKSKVLELIKTGMSLKDALAAIKTGAGTGTGGGGTQTAALYYPQYYSTWAGLPSGQKYG